MNDFRFDSQALDTIDVDTDTSRGFCSIIDGSYKVVRSWQSTKSTLDSSNYIQFSPSTELVITRPNNKKAISHYLSNTSINKPIEDILDGNFHFLDLQNKKPKRVSVVLTIPEKDKAKYLILNHRRIPIITIFIALTILIVLSNTLISEVHQLSSEDKILSNRFTFVKQNDLTLSYIISEFKNSIPIYLIKNHKDIKVEKNKQLNFSENDINIASNQYKNITLDTILLKYNNPSYTEFSVTRVLSAIWNKTRYYDLKNIYTLPLETNCIFDSKRVLSIKDLSPGSTRYSKEIPRDTIYFVSNSLKRSNFNDLDRNNLLKQCKLFIIDISEYLLIIPRTAFNDFPTLQLIDVQKSFLEYSNGIFDTNIFYKWIFKSEKIVYSYVSYNIDFSIISSGSTSVKVTLHEENEYNIIIESSLAELYSIWHKSNMKTTKISQNKTEFISLHLLRLYFQVELLLQNSYSNSNVLSLLKSSYTQISDYIENPEEKIFFKIFFLDDSRIPSAPFSSWKERSIDIYLQHSRFKVKRSIAKINNILPFYTNPKLEYVSNILYHTDKEINKPFIWFKVMPNELNFLVKKISPAESTSFYTSYKDNKNSIYNSISTDLLYTPKNLKLQNIITLMKRNSNEFENYDIRYMKNGSIDINKIWFLPVLAFFYRINSAYSTLWYSLWGAFIILTSIFLPIVESIIFFWLFDLGIFWFILVALNCLELNLLSVILLLLSYHLYKRIHFAKNARFPQILIH